jgi:hypothetical protein
LWIPLGRRANARNVRAGFRLGDAIGDLGAHAENLRQHGLLALRAVAHQQGRDELDEAALIGDGGVTPAQFLHHHRIGQRIETRPAERFRHADAEEAELGHFIVKPGREALLAIQFLGYRPDHFVGECARSCVSVRYIRVLQFSNYLVTYIRSGASVKMEKYARDREAACTRVWRVHIMHYLVTYGGETCIQEKSGNSDERIWR